MNELLSIGAAVFAAIAALAVIIRRTGGQCTP
jgi:hypothetical protein